MIYLLGWLFKNKTIEKKKTNLLVFLTPHIIREADHLARLTDEKKLEFARVKERYKEGELLIKFKDGIPEEKIAEILRNEGATVISQLKDELYHIKLKEGQEVKKAIEIFRKYQEIEYAEPNYIRQIK